MVQQPRFMFRRLAVPLVHPIRTPYYNSLCVGSFLRLQAGRTVWAPAEELGEDRRRARGCEGHGQPLPGLPHGQWRRAGEGGEGLLCREGEVRQRKDGGGPSMVVIAQRDKTGRVPGTGSCRPPLTAPPSPPPPSPAPSAPSGLPARPPGPDSGRGQAAGPGGPGGAGGEGLRARAKVAIHTGGGLCESAWVSWSIWKRSGAHVWLLLRRTWVITAAEQLISKSQPLLSFRAP